MSIHQSAEALHEGGTAEVDEQPYGLVGQSEVGEQLLRVRGMQAINRLDFDKQSFIHQKVDPERRVETITFELNIDRVLTRNRIAHLRQLTSKHSFINSLEQART